jgi:hypothetical protein
MSIKSSRSSIALRFSGGILIKCKSALAKSFNICIVGLKPEAYFLISLISGINAGASDKEFGLLFWSK